MVEAKVSKLKEYFTDITQHNSIKPSDLSGEKLFVGNMRVESALRKESPIRFNDTYRSNILLGSDQLYEAPMIEEQAGHRSRSSNVSLRNIMID
jgi:hypothetical protein